MFPEGVFCIKGPLVQTVIEFVPSYNAENAHSIKYELVFLSSDALCFFDCYLSYCKLLLEDFVVLPGDEAERNSEWYFLISVLSLLNSCTLSSSFKFKCHLIIS